MTDTFESLLREARKYVEMQNHAKMTSYDFNATETVLLSRIDALLATGGWLPIETAPGDGKQVLLGCLTHKTVFYGFFVDGNWRSPCDDEGNDFFCAARPTHWQPLPTPPKKENGNG